MNACVVRRAGLSDLEELSNLFDQYRRFYGRESDIAAARAFLAQRFDNGDSVAFIARNENGVADGFTQLYPSFSSVSLARIFILNDLFVRPDARRKGVAQRLLEAAVDYGKEAGAVRISLSTAIVNTEAQALYGRCGWRKDEQFYVYHFAAAG